MVTEAPVLVFRDGLRIATVAGGYGGFTTLFPEIFLDLCYQPTPEFIAQPGWTIVDVGANMGFYTCQVARATPRVRIVAVEPVPCYTEILRRNIAENGFGNVVVIEAAVVGQPRTSIPLRVWRSSPGGEPKTHEPPAGLEVAYEQIDSPAVTLGEVFQRGHVGRCDLLKVDIEGGEYELFDNVPAELWSRVDRVVMETHRQSGRLESDLASLLRQHSFRVSQDERTHMLWARK